MIHKILRIFQVAAICIIALCLTFPLTLSIYWQFYYQNKIFPKITIAQIEVAKLTSQKALNILQENINRSNFNNLTFTFQNQDFIISLPELNFRYSSDDTITQALNIGRSKELSQVIIDRWELWQHGKNLNLQYYLDQSLLQDKITTLKNQINVPITPPNIELKKWPSKTIIVNPGYPGRILDESKLHELINIQLGQLKTETLPLPINEISPNVSTAAATATKLRAEKLLGKQVKLTFQNNTWVLGEEEIINLLDFQTGFDREKIASYTAELAKTIDRPAQNALFNFASNKVIAFQPAKDGQVLNLTKTADQINGALISLEQGSDQATIDLSVDFIKPLIETKDVNDLGIKELLGKGESWFYGSIPGRIHNIQIATKKITGLLIPPGETFSFNQAVGDISSQTGYQQAYIIKEGRTVLGDGGGVCQVSTTLFRAALYAGLPIVERRAHAYRVSYYEQNYQPGVDATVFDPTDDLKFKNDTPANILIQSEIDLNKLKLTFYLYGTADGRKTTISTSRIWDQTPPPPDLYQDDPTLPKGAVKQVDWKAWGAKVAFDWKVSRADEVLQNRTFYSYYKPWQAVFLKGPT